VSRRLTLMVRALPGILSVAALALAACVPATAAAQTRDRSGAFTWAVPAGGPGSDDGDGIGPSPGGGVVVSGGFARTIRFDAAHALTSASPLDDVFAAAYDGDGRVRWVRRFGGPGIDHAFDNDVDATGNALITGTFADVVSFGPSTLTSRGATLAQYGDAFLLRLDPTGAPRWVRQIGGTGSDGGDEVAAGPGGDAFVIGDSDGATRFSPTVELPATGGRDAWAARYRPDGRLAWARSLGGSGLQQSHGISADREGHALVTGEHRGETRFGHVVLGSDGARPDVFVAKLDRRGRVRWAQRFGGPGEDRGRGVDADGEGHVLFSGEFSGTIRLGATTLTSAGGTDLFVAKAGRGGRILWAVGMGGPGDEVGPEIEVDAHGATHLAGSFAGQARFGDRTLTAPGARAAFVARLTSRGRFAWVAQSGASPFTTLGELALAPGRLSLLGRFAGTATLGRFPLAGAGRTDAFVAQLPTR
jgi:hypothetical protein